MKRLNYLFGILAVAICAAPAQAGNWIMVYADGERSSRTAYYVDVESLRSQNSPAEQLDILEGKKPQQQTKKQIQVIQVMESPKMPDRMSYTIDINCQSNQMRISDALALLYSGTIESMPNIDWHPIHQTWASQTAKFACNEAEWKTALAQDMKNPDNPTELLKLGFLPFGEYHISSDLVDATWQTFWRDGKRPEYTGKMTPEEIARRNEELGQQIAAARQHLAAMTQLAQGELSKMKERDTIRQEIAQRKKDHPNTPAFQRMQGWLGLDEKLILQSWGTPANIYDTGKTRFISYNRGYQERWVIPTVDGGQIIENNFNCEITFELQRGEQLGYQIVDFKLAGNSCKSFRL
jgi:hypothetical protein